METIKPVKVINRNMLIKQIRKDFGRRFTKKDITDILDYLEYYVSEFLSEANENNDISIRLFYGLHLDSTLKPDRKKSFLGKFINVPASVEATAHLTRYYNQKLNRTEK